MSNFETYENICEFLDYLRRACIKKSFILKDEITVVQVSDMTHGSLFQWPRISPSNKLSFDYNPFKIFFATIVYYWL